MENTTDLLQVKINEGRSTLSKESREAIDNIDWRLIILGMNKKYNPDQLDNLETETELLLCGILSPEIYPIEIENRMHITKEEVGLLIGEMDRLVFRKIRDGLKTILEKGGGIKVENKPLIFDPRFLNMPRDVQEAIARSNWKENLYKIAQKHKLTIEQMGILEETTIKVMSNVIYPDNYERELSSKIAIEKEEMTSLIKDVNDEILLSIRELLRKRSELVENTKNIGDDKIPLPPYSKIRTSTYVEPIQPIKLKIEPSVVEKIPEIPKNIIEEKLKQTTMSEPIVSDYSIPKIVNPSSSGIHDPYREDF